MNLNKSYRSRQTDWGSHWASGSMALWSMLPRSYWGKNSKWEYGLNSKGYIMEATSGGVCPSTSRWKELGSCYYALQGSIDCAWSHGCWPSDLIAQKDGQRTWLWLDASNVVNGTTKPVPTSLKCFFQGKESHGLYCSMQTLMMKVFSLLYMIVDSTSKDVRPYS